MPSNLWFLFADFFLHNDNQISAGNLRFWMVIPHSRKYMEEHKQKQQKQKSAEASKTISNRFVRVWILTAHRGLQLQSPRLESVVQQTNKLPIGILKTQNTLFNIWQTKVFIKEYLFDTKQGANEFTSVVASSSSSSSSRAVNRYSNNNENGEADEDDEDDVFIYDTIKNWIVRTKTIWQNGDFIDTDNVLLLEDGLPSNEYSDDESDFA